MVSCSEREREREMGAKILMSNLQRMKEKVIDESVGASLTERVDGLFPPDTREILMSNLQRMKEKVIDESMGASLTERVDGLFPPETRERLLHWLQVATPFIITAVVLLLCFCICSLCWGLFFFVVGRAVQIICLCCAQMCRLICYVVGKAVHVCCLCCRGAGRAVQMMFSMIVTYKMMKDFERDHNMPSDDDDIPGRNHRTPWDSVASNPRTYFGGLRGKPVDDDFDL